MKRYKIIEDGIEYDVEEDPEGDKWWSLNDKLHRENGPAVELCDGYKAWHKYGRYHNENGPARIWASGKKEYWLNNSYYSNAFSDNEWIIFQIIT
jgi:hypothetical protein